MTNTPKRKIQEWTPEQEKAALKEIEPILANIPHLFERVNDNGEADPNGTHWQARTHH
jgi:hypothetical protein